MKRLVLLLLLISLSWILPGGISPGIATAPDPPPQGASSHFGNPTAPDLPNPTEFWALFNSVSAWDLEYDQGAGWSSVKEDLTILRNYTTPWVCKITLIFNSSYQADYRLTFLIDRRVQNYSYLENKTRYLIAYQNWTVFFSWKDLLGIPGLQFTHGVTEVAGKPSFWFRLRRDNVPQGTYLELDPSFGYDEKGGSSSDLEDYMRGSSFTCPEDGIAKNISACILHTGGVGLRVRCAIYHTGNKSLLAETEEKIAGAGWAWYTFDITSPVGGAPVYSGSSYILMAWGSFHTTPEMTLYYTAGSPGQGYGKFNAYGTEYPWLNPLSDYSSNNHQYSIYCSYSLPPTIGEFSASASTIWANEWFKLNCTVNEASGYTGLKNCSLALNGSVVLHWENSTHTFSLGSDPNGYCAVNSSASTESQKNSTALELSWSLLLTWSYPQGNISVLSSTVYNQDEVSGSGSQEDLFQFEPDIRMISATPSADTVDIGVSLEVSGTLYYEGKNEGPQNVTGLWARLELNGSLINSATPGTDGTYTISFVSPQTEGDHSYIVYSEANPLSVLNQTFMITVSKQRGGGFTSGARPTPLEELGVPTPLPYEVAPPEAQWGTIGLIVILTGAVIYYLRRPKGSLWRGQMKPRKRKIQQKQQPKRRIHKKA